jgi:hypothetical protein
MEYICIISIYSHAVKPFFAENKKAFSGFADNGIESCFGSAKLGIYFALFYTILHFSHLFLHLFNIYDTIATEDVAIVRIRVPSGPAGDGGIIMASIMIQ